MNFCNKKPLLQAININKNQATHDVDKEFLKTNTNTSINEKITNKLTGYQKLMANNINKAYNTFAK